MKQLVEVPVFPQLPIENVLRFANESLDSVGFTQLSKEHVFGLWTTRHQRHRLRSQAQSPLSQRGVYHVYHLR